MDEQGEDPSDIKLRYLKDETNGDLTDFGTSHVEEVP